MEDVVWGMAYFIDSNDREAVIEHLNFREKNGYSMDTVSVYLESGQVLTDQV